MKINKKILSYLFIVSVFFPYISIYDFGSDQQPFSVLTGALLILFYRKNFLISEFLIFIILFVSIVIFLLGETNFLSVRSLFNYVSFFIVSFVSYRVLTSGIIKFDFILKYCILLWFFVSFVQFFYSRDFLTFIVANSRTTVDRGVTGLSPEPTFLGIVFIFFILYLLHKEVQHKYKFISLCIIGIVFFAQSSMAVLFLMILLLLFLIINLSLKSAIKVLALILIIFLSFSFFENSRMYKIINIIFDDPYNIISLDASINDRFFHIYFSLLGFYDNYFLPNGFTEWLPYVSSKISIYNNLIFIEWFSLGGRIMSGYGAVFYELGFFALLIPSTFFIILGNIYFCNIKKLIFHFLFINIIMFSAIPIGFSMFGFYVGYLNFLVWERRQKLLDNSDLI
jgi:hypothetical protein